MGIFGNKSATSQSNTAVTGVNNQFLVQLGATALGTSVTPNTTQLISNYKGLPLSSLKLHLSVVDVTANTVTVNDTTYELETVIKQFQILSSNGKILMDLDGSRDDISIFARLLTTGGKYTPSPVSLSNVATTAYSSTTTWDILLPFAIAPSDFPLKLNVSFNTLGSRISAGTALASSTVTLSVYGNYEPISYRRSILVVKNIGVSATGTATLNTSYDYGKVYQTQAYAYNTDSYIGSTGVTFSRDGGLEISNATLQNFIDKENTVYANSVPVANQDSAKDTGHIAGLINLFTSPFVATPASQLQINFATAPKSLNGLLANTLVQYAVEDY